jgi:hypothetical protein
MKLSAFQTWLVLNAALLSKVFGTNNVLIDDNKWRCLQIMNFTLPINWNRCISKLLIEFPSRNNSILPPDRFYIERGLKTTNGHVPEHYFENDYFNDKASEGWARFSFHIEGNWQPSLDMRHGTTMIKVLDSLYNGMYKAAQEAF